MSERTMRGERWQRAAEWPLMTAAVAFLAGYAVPILWPQVNGTVRLVCEITQWLAWGLFVLDYVVRLAFAGDRAWWVLRHLLDLAVIALPLLRPLRLLRLVTLLNVLNRRASVGLRGRVAAYLAGGSVLLSFVAALAVLDAERTHPDASITSFGDAWWWALTTMTTVGYGDTFPVTTTGRFIAAALMVGGIALLGTVTATLASWLADRVREEEAAADDVLAELRALRTEIADLRASSRVDGTPGNGARRSPAECKAPIDEGGHRLL